MVSGWARVEARQAPPLPTYGARRLLREANGVLRSVEEFSITSLLYNRGSKKNEQIGGL